MSIRLNNDKKQIDVVKSLNFEIKPSEIALIAKIRKNKLLNEKELFNIMQNCKKIIEEDLTKIVLKAMKGN